MNKFIATICAAAMAVTTLGASAIPATAAPVQASFSFGLGNADLLQVRGHRHRGFEWRGKRGYYNNYRGYRDRRPGFRHFNGFWFPPAAFSFSIDLTPRRHYREPIRLSSRHVAWCYDRYRSYRDWDNTFQPYHGPRKQCISPFMR